MVVFLYACLPWTRARSYEHARRNVLSLSKSLPLPIPLAEAASSARRFAATLRIASMRGHNSPWACGAQTCFHLANCSTVTPPMSLHSSFVSLPLREGGGL